MPIAVTGNPGRPIDGDWGFYGIIDQLIWRLPGSEDPKGVGVFGRVMGAPSDQNLVDFYAEGGITFTGMIPASGRRRPRHRLRLYRHLQPSAQASTSISACPVCAQLRGSCWRSATPLSSSPAGRCNLISNTSSSPAATCPADVDGREKRWWGRAPVSVSDEGRVHSPHSRFRERIAELSDESIAETGASRALIVGAIAVRGGSAACSSARWQTYGDDADAALDSLLAPTTDFTKLEAGEAKPGGGATSRGSTDTPNAFSLSSGNMDFKRELDFKVGNGIFRKNWVSAPSSTDASDGLGPLFNSRACQNCHLKDGRGHPPLSSDVPDDSGSMLVRLSVPPATDEEKALLDAHKVNSLPDPTYGGQLQDFAIQGIDAGGQAQDRLQGAQGEARRRRDRLACACRTYSLDRPRLRARQPRHHDLARASRRR